jgi:hypothetical protein
VNSGIIPTSYSTTTIAHPARGNLEMVRILEGKIAILETDGASGTLKTVKQEPTNEQPGMVVSGTRHIWKMHVVQADRILTTGGRTATSLGCDRRFIDRGMCHR